MGLQYKRSNPEAARAYERSPGMEPNPGVSHLTVVNPGRAPRGKSPRENPFQWIEGRGQRHRHVSPKYGTLKGAAAWTKRHPKSGARLYPVDERGTIVSRPVSKKLLSNSRREDDMAYNIAALRRAMRSNPRGRSAGVEEIETGDGVTVRSRRRKHRSTKKRSTAGRRTARRTTRRAARRGSARRRSTGRRSTGRRSTGRRSTGRRRSRRGVRRNSKKYARGWERTFGKKRASKKRTTKKRTTRATAPKRRRSRRRRSRASHYWGRRPVSRRGREYLDKYISKGLMPAVAPAYRTGKSRSGRPPVRVYPIPAGQGRLSRRKTRLTSRRRGPARRRTRARAVGATYRGTRARRMTANRRRSRRSSRRRRTRRNTMYATANPRRRRRRSRPGLYANRRRRSSRRRRSRRRVSANRRRSRRGRSRRRRSRRVSPNRRRSRRGSRRRSRRRVSLRPNLLSTSKARWGGRGAYRTGRPVGRTFQVLAYGPGSKTRRTKSGRRRRVSGYPVYVPGHVIETAAVRRYRGLGGAAKDAHTRAKRRGYRERKRYPRRRVKKNTRRMSMRSNRRRSRRRRSTRRNPKYVVVNRRRRRSSRRKSRRSSRWMRPNRRRSRRRRMRRNIFGGADVMRDVVTPVLGGTAGFVGARVLSNALANIEGLRNILDKDKPAAEATNTKIAANLVGILATLGLATRVDIIKRNQGALITGMGLALTDRLLSKITGDAAQYLGGFGEYVSQPLGEYVSQPLGAYVQDPGMGTTLYAAAGLSEYVDQPLGNTLYAAAGLGYAEGVDPADQGGVDGLMDVMEAAAGMGAGPIQAAAGMGTMYATAGLGAEADASLQSYYARHQPPFASIQTPTDMARPVTRTMPYAKPVPDSLVTPEGRGYAGGLFARNLFAGML